MSWTCPRCERSFTNANQWHSCHVSDVDEHFVRAAPRVREAFDAILAGLPQDVRVEAVKTTIHLRGRSAAFGSITVRRTHLRLGLLLDHRLRHPRVARVETLSTTRYAHGVDVSTPEEVDAELLGWLTEAYALRA